MKNGKYQNGASKRVLVLALALVLLLGCGIGGTIAWLTANSGTVTNTFTVGDIDIKLEEHPFKANSTTELDTTATPVTAIDTYKVVPGGSQPKDPFVTVEKESEKCYVYVCIENQLVIGDDVVGTIDVTSDWTAIRTNDNKTLYRYNSVVDAAAEDKVLPVFTKVQYDGEKILKTNIETLDGKKIILNAFAHQSDNTTQTVADAAANDYFFPTATP